MAPTVATATVSVRAAVCPRAVCVPGGSTSSSPRAGVEQYSRATQRPSSTRSRGTPASSAAIGSTKRFGGDGAAVGHLHDDAEQALVAERDLEQSPDPHIAQPLGNPVVVRARAAPWRS